MSNIDALFASARLDHQAGNLRRAEALYREVLQADPNHADAWQLLGELCQIAGKRDEAVACCRQALRLQPNSADTH